MTQPKNYRFAPYCFRCINREKVDHDSMFFCALNQTWVTEDYLCDDYKKKLIKDDN